jgi:glutamyl-Q tRNA(Asp) synthetase
MSPVGRFAPSPTGDLHLGSLYVALASYLSVKSRNGRWLIRMDDLDTQRSVPGAERRIIETLALHGLQPDAPVIYQSKNTEQYSAALTRLFSSGRLFACSCSRKDLEGSPIHSGACRSKPLDPSISTLRFRVGTESVSFPDQIMGAQQFRLDREIGDFIVRRRDASIAYPLACAVDDGNGVITEVLRGADLLSATAAQIKLMSALALKPPDYAHLPVLRNNLGQKLSKQTFARPLETNQVSRNIRLCLTWLAISLPKSAESWSVHRLIEHATRIFDIGLIPRNLPAGIAE